MSRTFTELPGWSFEVREKSAGVLPSHSRNTLSHDRPKRATFAVVPRARHVGRGVGRVRRAGNPGCNDSLGYCGALTTVRWRRRQTCRGSAARKLASSSSTSCRRLDLRAFSMPPSSAVLRLSRGANDDRNRVCLGLLGRVRRRPDRRSPTSSKRRRGERAIRGPGQRRGGLGRSGRRRLPRVPAGGELRGRGPERHCVWGGQGDRPVRG
jgi:hypothetical protein